MENKQQSIFSFPSCSDTPLWFVWLSQHFFPVVTVSMELGIFDTLAKQSYDLQTLTTKLQLSARSIEALLSVLCGLDLVKVVGGNYQLTLTAKNYLVSSSPLAWTDRFLSYSKSLEHNRLKEVVESDKAWSGMATIQEWESGEITKERAVDITASMHAHSAYAAICVADAVDFSTSRNLLDVAGGSGVFALAVVKKNPHMKATILELSTVCEVVQEKYITEEFKSQVNTLSLHMFQDEWPSETFDVHFYSNVFHDWNASQCHLLATKSFESLPSGGRIMLHEMLLKDQKDGELIPAAFSLHMLLYTKGKQFTFAELEGILASVGFTDIHVEVTHELYSVVVGTKP